VELVYFFGFGFFFVLKSRQGAMICIQHFNDSVNNGQRAYDPPQSRRSEIYVYAVIYMREVCHGERPLEQCVGVPTRRRLRRIIKAASLYLLVVTPRPLGTP